MSESTHRKGHHHLKQFLVMIVLHATIIIEIIVAPLSAV